MRQIRLWVPTIVLWIAAIQSQAQVLPPAEIKDVALRALQQKYLSELKSIGEAIRAHEFAYAFNFSRKLGLDQKQQPIADQRSIRFEKFEGQVVLEFTGNYYASYSAELMDRHQRARQTFLDVMLPVLQSAVPPFKSNSELDAFGLEISHHVRKKVLGVSAENTENIALILPRTAAERLVAAGSPSEQQEALIQGKLYVDAEPFFLALTEGARGVPASSGKTEIEMPNGGSSPGAGAVQTASTPGRMATMRMSIPPLTPAKAPDAPVRDVSPEGLQVAQKTHQDLLDRIVREMDTQAHFVSYSPPTYVTFRRAVYLQLTLTTTLDGGLDGSRYKLAALAFDEHVVHLVRPVLAYFKDDSIADGIVFSSTIRLAGKTAEGASHLAVEFFFPLAALRRYEQYDCTGQELINAGFVLINGERVGLDLQSAEADSRR